MGNATTFMRSKDSFLNEGLVTELAVDMLMMAEALNFVGTPDSTFSLGIQKIRSQRHYMETHGMRPTPEHELDATLMTYQEGRRLTTECLAASFYKATTL